MSILKAEDWESRYQDGNIGWDAGEVSTPIKEYFDQINDKSVKILIPGAGNSYEAEYLYHQGFKNVIVLDWSASALSNLKKRVPDFPNEQLISGDFFEHDGTYDYIVEQTFFCALHPSQRTDYVNKMHSLLLPAGKLVGLLFDDKLFSDHPPYGGSKKEYLPFFNQLFKVNIFERCKNSLAPRAGRELFINFSKA